MFLSHAGADSVAARAFAEILRRNGVEVWFDEDSLQPGERWMEAVEREIQSSSGMIVYVDRLGVQRWVDREIRLGLELNTRDPKAFKLIPVFGEGADVSSLPPFLSQHQGISAHQPEAIRRLLDVLRCDDSTLSVPSAYWATHSPFRSLRTFDPEDAWLFFGRDHDTRELVERLQRSRVLVVIGNSGSGKSSLVRAGLIPALQRGRLSVDGNVVQSWNVAVVRPGNDPFGELVDRLSQQLRKGLSPGKRDALISRWRQTFPDDADAVRNGIVTLSTEARRTLLFVDQFEELFTLAPERVRGRYINALLRTTESDGVHLILGLRADFYANCLTHEALRPHLQDNYSLSLMQPDQLREAIEKRLALAGACAEEGLTDRLLTDVGTEPGNLALLEHALGQLWEQNLGKYSTAPLTNRRYDEIGRLKGAIGKHAHLVYAGLTSQQQALARRMFVELVHLGEGAQDTRRRVPKETLLALARLDEAEALLEVLASKRLIAISAEQASRSAFVEVSHETLIREWTDLRVWVEEDREDLRFGRRLAADADDWNRSKEWGALLRGARLLKAKEWLTTHPAAPRTVLAFVNASAAEEDDAQANRLAQERQLREVAERLRKESEGREQAQREIANERQQRLTEQVRAYAKLRRTSTYLGITVVGLIIAGAWAWYQTRVSRVAADRSRKTLAASDFRQATDRRLAGELNEALAFYAAAARLDPNNAAIRAATLDALRAARWPFISLAHRGVVHSAALSADGTRVVTASADHTARVWDARTGQPVGLPLQHDDAVNAAAFSADSSLVVTASADKTARVWDARTGQPVGVPLQHDDVVNAAAFSADSTLVVTASGSTARVWDARTGQSVGAPLPHEDAVDSAAFSADATRVVTASGDMARVWDARRGQSLGAPFQHERFLYPAAFSADGTRVVTAQDPRTARVWDVRTGLSVGAPLQHADVVLSAVLNADGTRVLTVSVDKTARVWDTSTGQPLGAPLQHADQIASAAFSANGRRIVTASNDRTARVWDAQTGQPLGAPLQHKAIVTSAAFSADGTRVVTASLDNTVRVWDLRAGQSVGAPLQHEGPVNSATFSRDGMRVVTASNDTTARIWDVRTGQPVGASLHVGQRVVSAAFSVDGMRVVTASADKTARVWDAQTGQPVGAPLQHAAAVNSGVFSVDGMRVVTASVDRTARVWDAQTGQPVGAPLQHGGQVNTALFSVDGTLVVTASTDRTARVWDVRTGQPVGAPLQHGDAVNSAAFSADGGRIVTASADKTARVWDARTTQPVGAPLQHGDAVTSAAFSADGTRVVTGSADKTARVWDAQTGQQVGAPLQHGGPVTSAVFSADGTRVVTASIDKTARVWDAQTGEPVGAPLLHEERVRSAAFSVDGLHVVTVPYDTTARVWDVVTGTASDADLISAAAEALSGYTVNDTGGLIQVEDSTARIVSLRQQVDTPRSGGPNWT